MSWACTEATGQATQHGIVNEIQGSVQGVPPYFDGGKGFRFDYPSKSHWEMLTQTSATHWNRGDCYDHALLVELATKILGADCTAGKIYASRDDGNAWEDLDHHPQHANWDLRFVDTPGYNNWEGTVRLQEDSTWYYYTSVPDEDADHSTSGGGSIKLLRAYVLHYADGRQEYYDGGSGTGVYESLPPAP